MGAQKLGQRRGLHSKAAMGPAVTVDEIVARRPATSSNRWWRLPRIGVVAMRGWRHSLGRLKTSISLSMDGRRPTSASIEQWSCDGQGLALRWPGPIKVATVHDLVGRVSRDIHTVAHHLAHRFAPAGAVGARSFHLLRRGKSPALVGLLRGRKQLSVGQHRLWRRSGPTQDAARSQSRGSPANAGAPRPGGAQLATV